MTVYPSGISFPFRFSPAGGVAKDDGGDKVTSNLKALIYSAVRSRLIRKNVGTVGYQRVLRSMGTTASEPVKQLILEAINEFEPRAIGVTVDIQSLEDSTGTKIIADISYIFRNTGDPVSMSLELT
jgi:phage baseplate assembly protein W